MVIYSSLPLRRIASILRVFLRGNCSMFLFVCIPLIIHSNSLLHVAKLSQVFVVSSMVCQHETLSEELSTLQFTCSVSSDCEPCIIRFFSSDKDCVFFWRICITIYSKSTARPNSTFLIVHFTFYVALHSTFLKCWILVVVESWALKLYQALFPFYKQKFRDKSTNKQALFSEGNLSPNILNILKNSSYIAKTNSLNDVFNTMLIICLSY